MGTTVLTTQPLFHRIGGSAEAARILGLAQRVMARLFAWEPIPLKLPCPLLAPTPPPVPVPDNVRVKPGSRWQPRPPVFAPAGVTNVAMHKPVTSSDMDPVIGQLAYVTNGCKEEAQYNHVELKPWPQWVQIDLLAVHHVHAVVVWHEFGDARVYRDVIVQVADDPLFTRNVRTLFNNDHDNSSGLGAGEDWEYFETHEGLLVEGHGTPARYVRLYSNGSTADDLNRYTEVEVFALAAD
jgi:hypothetical protein